MLWVARVGALGEHCLYCEVAAQVIDRIVLGLMRSCRIIGRVLGTAVDRLKLMR